MYDILRTSIIKGRPELSTCNLPAWPAAGADPQDIWLFTDSGAREVYQQQNRLDQLQADITSYAMYEGRWAPEELAAQGELQRLLNENILIPKGTFCHLSPHATVYRALCNGRLAVAGQRLHVEAGEDIVFVPWLLRGTHPGLRGPMYIGRLRSTTHLHLCCDTFPAISAYCEKALAILHQTLSGDTTG
jgi:hypothetical protein